MARKTSPVSLKLSRERSWLSFNQRVLLQATRPDFPLLERLRFLGIFANNLDEFFTARLQNLRKRVRATRTMTEDRHEYLGLLEAARAETLEASNLLTQLKTELFRAGIQLLEPHDLTNDEEAYAGAFLAEQVAPLTDIIMPQGVQYMDSRASYLAAGRERLEYLVRVPEGSPRLFEIPGRRGAWVRLEALMASRSDLFLPTQTVASLPMFPVRVTRGANIELKGNVDWEDLAHALEGRLDGLPARLELDQDCPWGEDLRQRLGLWKEEVFCLAPPLDHRFLESLANLKRPELQFTPNPPRKRTRFHQNPFEFLEKQDLALYHPGDDYGTVVNFVQAAARNPQVSKLRATLYRLGRNNPIAEGLLEAAKAGKDVAVFLEGRARFDELANLYWQLRFKSAGVKVFPYPPDLKVHAKVLLVQAKGRNFIHLGTGNYNPATAKLYTDLSLLTANEGLTRDALEFFQALSEGRMPKLELMKVGLQAREAMLERIRGESHERGHIILKLNHLTDPIVLEALSLAAESGAKVDLIVRSSLTLIHPKFRVRSLIGRYLEHSRMAAFKQGGDWAIWAGSADWMPRNFERRLELVFPVQKKKVRDKVLTILKAQLEDDKNTFLLSNDGSQRALWGGTRDSQLVKL